MEESVVNGQKLFLEFVDRGAKVRKDKNDDLPPTAQNGGFIQGSFLNSERPEQALRAQCFGFYRCMQRFSRLKVTSQVLTTVI